jgi:glycosyltransferase involved in cell wall biosynthesis
MDSCIDIVLASYNGEQYIEQQIRSIQGCEHYNELVSRFIISDDGSSDKTREIIQRCATTDPKIELHDAPRINNINTTVPLGPIANFNYGISLTTSYYIMLCDQDDIWLPHKIRVSFTRMLQLEQYHQSKNNQRISPLLVFSDMYIVDDELNVLEQSYFTLKHIEKNWHESFEQLLQQNVVSGCTMLFNRPLLEQAMPIPSGAYMHDWWFALMASRYGTLELINQPLILYRQHSNNTIGAKITPWWQWISLFIPKLKGFQCSFFKVITQAQALQQYENEIDIKNHSSLVLLATFPTMKRIQRLKYILNGKIKRSYWVGTIALILTALMMPTVKA